MERCAREMVSKEQIISQLLPLARNLVCWDDSGWIRQLPIGLGAARVADGGPGARVHQLGSERTDPQEATMSSLTLLQSLHENLASRAQVKSVFGDAVTAGEKTIIPVAKIAYGFGAGAGTGGMGEETRPKGEGGGGGGGVRAVPVGVFEVSARETRFVPIHDRKKTVGTLLLGAVLGLLFAKRKRLR
jgi:uncharacterized spore protein YtfJ